MCSKQISNAEYSSSRLEAFSDGVFAIAITLLVLNIQLPENAGKIPIDKALLLTIPKLEIWLISFFIIGGMWIRHHKLIKQITVIDETFIVLNLIYLMLVTITPWLVSVVVTYSGQAMAIAVFSGGITILGIINLITWIYLSNIKHYINSKISEYEKKLTLYGNIIYVFIALISIIVAYNVNNSFGLYCYFLNPIISGVLKNIIKKPNY